MNRVPDDAPDSQLLLRANKDVPMPPAAGAQQYPLGYAAELLDGEFAIDHGNHNTPIDRLQGAVNHQQVAIMDAEADHGSTCHPDKERGLLVLDQVFIETQALLEIVGRRRRKSCWYGLRQQRVAW